MHSVNDVICPETVRFCQLIKAHNDQSHRRQAIQHPRVRPPERGHLMDAEVEQRSNHAADYADSRRVHRPLQKRPAV